MHVTSLGRGAGRVVTVVALAGSALLFAGVPAALAGCHHFSVAASPNPVTEGTTLSVTVSRDGALAASHVDVSTVDESAKAGTDYVSLKRTASFTSETSQSFPLAILDDKGTGEPAQTFRLHLSNPGGCAVNPNFVVDPDVTVTIIDHDAAPGPASPPSAPAATSSRAPTARPATQPGPGGASSAPTPSGSAPSSNPSPTNSDSVAPSPAPTSPPTLAGAKKNSNTGPLVGGLAGALAVAAAGGYLWRRTRARS